MPKSFPRPNAESVHIRPAMPVDITSIMRIEQRAETAAHWTLQQYEELFASEASQCIALISADSTGEQVHGFVIARSLGSDWEIENIAVNVEDRRCGIGSDLVRQLLRRLEEAGATGVLLEVRDSNLVALRLYEKLGFRQDGRRRKYYHNPSEDALLLRFRLQPCDKIP